MNRCLLCDNECEQTLRKCDTCFKMQSGACRILSDMHNIASFARHMCRVCRHLQNTNDPEANNGTKGGQCSAKVRARWNNMRRRHVQYDTIHEPLSRDDLCDKMNNGTALCAYCDHYIASGLDRVDPTFGYTNENTVACCVLCNFSKTDFSVDVFVTKACDICQKWSHEIMQ